jgi:hypothetical protein
VVRTPGGVPRQGLSATFAAAVAVLLAACNEQPTELAGPGPPADLSAVSGSAQETVAGGPFPEPVVVRLVDAEGRPVPDRTLSATAHGRGWLVEDHVATDGEGLARFDWYAGARPDEAQRLQITLGLLRVDVEGTATAPSAGTSYFGHRGWVEYVPGTLPFVIAAPHGGDLTPPDIPDRSGPGVVTVKDLRTRQLAFQLGDVLEDRTGARPHLVILHLRRTKLDANRSLEQAALGHPLAERAWHEFHAWIETAKAAVLDGFGEGFFMDLHGHGHELQALELGYLLTASDLARPDAELDEPWAVEKSSLRTLPARAGLPHATLVRGPASLGALYEAEGYLSMPSETWPDPAGNPFFSGGYNTRRHGCRDGGSLCGYQLELNWQGVRDTAGARAGFAAAHARVMEAFFREQYDMELGGSGSPRGSGSPP